MAQLRQHTLVFSAIGSQNVGVLKQMPLKQVPQLTPGYSMAMDHSMVPQRSMGYNVAKGMMKSVAQKKNIRHHLNKARFG